MWCFKVCCGGALSRSRLKSRSGQGHRMMFWSVMEVHFQGQGRVKVTGWRFEMLWRCTFKVKVRSRSQDDVLKCYGVALSRSRLKLRSGQGHRMMFWSVMEVHFQGQGQVKVTGWCFEVLWRCTFKVKVKVKVRSRSVLPMNPKSYQIQCYQIKK